LPFPPLAHKRGERGVRPHGEALENKCKPKLRAKSQEGATMVKRFVHLKKNMMMIITTFASYT
jgi:hypothetical protein